MAIEIATAYVQVVPSMKGVGKAIIDAFDVASETAGANGGKKAGKGFANGLGMQGAIIGAASAVTSKAMNVISGSIGSAVNRADQMNNFPKVMRNLGYSSEDAAASIKKISASLDGLPTTSSAMTGMVQQLAPLTSNLDEATNIALAFNNAMLAGGASTMEQENALAQLTQMMAAGKVDMQAWRSVQAAMPGQLNQVAEAMMGAGHNANDLYDAMKDGKYGFDEFNSAVVRLNSKGFSQYASFAQQAKDATQGIGTAMENVQNRVAKAVQKVVEAVGVEDIAGAVNSFSSQFGKIGDGAANMVTGVKNWLGQAAQTAKPLVSIWQSDFGRLGMYMQGLSANAQAFGKSLLAVIADGGGMQNFLVGLNNIISALVKMVTTATRNVSIFIGALSDSGGVQSFLASLSELWKGLTQLGQSLMDAATGFIAVGAHGGAAASVGQLVGGAFNAAAPLVKNLASALQSIGEWASEHGELIRAAIIGIGGAFAAVKGYQALNSGLQALTGTMNAVTSAAKGISNGVMLMMDLGGPIQMLKQMGSSLNIVKAAQSAWSAATKMATAVQGAFNAVLAANPIGVIITLIAAIVAALVWFFTQTETGRKAWASFMQWLQSAWQAIVSVASGIWNGLTSFFSGLWQEIKNVFSNAVEAIKSFLLSTFGQAILVIFAPFIGVPNLIMQNWDAISSFFVSLWNGIVSFVQPIVQGIGEFIKNVFIVVAAVLVTIWNDISTAMQTVWNAVFQYFTNVWNGLVAFIAPIIASVQSVIANALNAIQSTWTSVWNAVSSFVSSVWNGIVSLVTSYINNVRSVISTVLNAISGVWSSIWSGVSGFVSNIWRGIASAVANGVNTVANKVRSIKDTVLGAVSGAGQWLYDAGQQIIQGLINGIGGAFGWLKDKITSLGSNVLSWAKDVLGIHSPSRVFRDQVGVMIVRGMAEGIDQSQRIVNRSLDRIAAGLTLDDHSFGSPLIVGMAGGASMPRSNVDRDRATDEQILDELIALHADLPLIVQALGIDVDGREIGRIIRKYQTA